VLAGVADCPFALRAHERVLDTSCSVTAIHAAQSYNRRGGTRDPKAIRYCTVRVTVVLRDSEADVPTTCTVYVPAGVPPTTVV
jgi:hypothetical protein